MNVSNILNGLNFSDYPEKTQDTMTTLLSICDKYKITNVGVAAHDGTFKDTKIFTCCAWLYIDGEDNFKHPIVWRVAEETDKILFNKYNEKYVFGRGCGNTGCFQIDRKNIVPGVYKKINNKWVKTA